MVSDVFLPQRNIFVLTTDSSFETQCFDYYCGWLNGRGLKKKRIKIETQSKASVFPAEMGSQTRTAAGTQQKLAYLSGANVS